jgi:radical SAM protein with 4Fe4S-binding SPASM domain
METMIDKPRRHDFSDIKFVIRQNAYLVQGAKRAALYDLNSGDIFSIDPISTRILMACEAQEPVGDIIKSIPSVEGDDIISYLKTLEKEDIGKFLPLSVKHKRTPQKRPGEKLRFAWLNLTDRCNLRCIHCYSESGSPKTSFQNMELTTGEWKEVIEDIYRCGCRELQYIGGEPFLYGPDIFTLIRHAKDMGFEFQEVFTNATLLQESHIDNLCDYGVHVGISIYSSRPEIHDTITGVEGSFRKTLMNARRMRDREIPLRIGIIAMKANQDSFQETRQFVQDEFDYHGPFDLLRASGRGCRCELIPDKLVHLRRRSNPDFPKVTKEQFFKALYGHVCWMGKLSIQPDGKVTPCIMEREETLGSVRKEPLSRILEGRNIRRLWGLSKDQVRVCRDCEFRYGCFDCRPHAKGQTGGLYDRGLECTYDPYHGAWLDPV